MNPHAGKLYLHHELSPDERTSPTFTKIPSIEKQRFGYRCNRCGNTNTYRFGNMPHATCGQNCRYCRHCIQMGRVTECEPLYIGSSYVEWPHYQDPLQWDGQLTVAQQQGADAIVDAMAKGEAELLVWAVCGAGKTEMLFPGLAFALTSGKRVCLATPRADVVRELVPRLKVAFPDVAIQGLYGDSPDKGTNASFIVATTHQLLRYASAFDVMIIDELDAFPFHHEESLQFAARRAAKSEATRIYLTATPRKKEKWRVRLKKLPVVFIPKRFHGHPLLVPTLHLTPTLPYHMNRKQLPASIVNAIIDQQKTERQLLVFLPSVQMTEWVAEVLEGHGLLAEQVHAGDPERIEKVQSFREKQATLLLTTTILERGVTFPSVDVFVIDAGHLVFDEAALVQIAGRAGRSPDDPDGDVRFYHAGKTNAMLDAYESIMKMNKLGAGR